jgi:hypothetical protein
MRVEIWEQYNKVDIRGMTIREARILLKTLRETGVDRGFIEQLSKVMTPLDKLNKHETS